MDFVANTVTILSVLCAFILNHSASFLLDDESCTGLCSRPFNSAYPCQCNAPCVWNNDCCPNYLAVCVGSCAGNCSRPFNPSYACQCNEPCIRNHDCCPDYQTVCSGSGSGSCSQSFTDVTEALWANDVNKLDHSHYSLDVQSRVSASNTVDRSSRPLFSHVNEGAFQSRPTFQSFMALLDNYNPASSQPDPSSSTISHEINQFLSDIMQTSVMHTLFNYLKCQNKVSSEQDMENLLRGLWFTPYARSSNGHVADSSGFEHVLVGDFKSGKVGGLHNWLTFYLREKTREINYYGYIETGQPDLVTLNFLWDGNQKPIGGFFVGTSPEFQIALDTLCFVTKNSVARLGGHNVRIVYYDVDHVPGDQIATAYPAIM